MLAGKPEDVVPDHVVPEHEESEHEERPSGREPAHEVAVLAYERMSAFELGIVTEVFGVHWPDVPRYRLRVCAEEPGSVTVIGGATLETPHGLDVLTAADTVVIPSVSDIRSGVSSELAGALRSAHHRGARMVSICSGAFALAAAGLLDGRRATTHWLYADALRERFPAVEVDPKPLYIDDGDVLTSAGSAAGIDLCLHLVRRDHGGAVANVLARRLVVPAHRSGGQAQYIEAPMAAEPNDGRVAASVAWALEHLAEPITVKALAEQAHMSPRTYERHFHQATGTSPIRWLINERVHASLPLLETSGIPIERVATTVGFETAVTYRHHFRRIMRTSPSSYRRAFQDRAGEADC